MSSSDTPTGVKKITRSRKTAATAAQLPIATVDSPILSTEKRGKSQEDAFAPLLTMIQQVKEASQNLQKEITTTREDWEKEKQQHAAS